MAPHGTSVVPTFKIVVVGKASRLTWTRVSASPPIALVHVIVLDFLTVANQQSSTGFLPSAEDKSITSTSTSTRAIGEPERTGLLGGSFA
jgi:hypothetical protein